MSFTLLQVEKCSFDCQMLFVAGEGGKNKDVYHLLGSEKLHNMHKSNLGVHWFCVEKDLMIVRFQWQCIMVMQR